MLTTRSAVFGILLSVGLSAMCASPALSADIYDNIFAGTTYALGGNTGFDQAGSNANGPLGDSFVAGPGTTIINAVSIIASNGGSPDGGSFMLFLANDAGDYPDLSPADALAISPNFSDNLLSSDTINGGLFTWDIGSITLQPDSMYWIVMEDVCSDPTNTACTDSSAQWAWASDTTGVGVANQFWSDTYGSYPNDTFDPPFLMDAVPEPASLTILGLALLALGAARKPVRQKWFSKSVAE